MNKKDEHILIKAIERKPSLLMLLLIVRGLYERYCIRRALRNKILCSFCYQERKKNVNNL